MDFLVLLADVIGVIEMALSRHPRLETIHRYEDTHALVVLKALTRHPCFGRLKSVNETPMIVFKI
ncbi:hypothetical protein [Alteromonas naphthalenivorans]|uniref:hypothetical protein n=1 Tax=Alteromonas naphthalenivorans TaxID=715451 RepID=UPI0011D28E53|nr:hypothetical protein [Alteromonas naphthalenivorans]